MDDYSVIQGYVKGWLIERGVVDISPFDFWFESMRLTRVRRDELLVHAGQASETLYLVKNGLLRLYYTTPDGRERNKAFFGDGHITGAISAAMTGSVAPFSIQALEDTEVIAANYQQFAEHSYENPITSRLFTSLLSEAFIRNEEREAILLTRNAEQRYEWLLETEAHLLERIPQFHLASYIGVDAVSLSRIRRKLKSGDHSGGRDMDSP
jgi:CRP-like cAMP-binding protein